MGLFVSQVKNVILFIVIINYIHKHKFLHGFFLYSFISPHKLYTSQPIINSFIIKSFSKILNIIEISVVGYIHSLIYIYLELYQQLKFEILSEMH